MKTNITNERNKLIGTLASLRESWGDNTQLFDLKDDEFTSGGYIGMAVKAAGYTEGGRAVVNANNWWTLTTKQFSVEVLASFDSANEAAAN